VATQLQKYSAGKGIYLLHEIINRYNQNISDGNYTSKADIFSLGCILYEAITGIFSFVLFLLNFCLLFCWLL
jgi:serine/threonine protein kinase